MDPAARELGVLGAVQASLPTPWHGALNNMWFGCLACAKACSGKRKVISLFSGVLGLDLGLSERRAQFPCLLDVPAASRLCEPIAFVWVLRTKFVFDGREVESDDYCTTVIDCRQKDGFFDPAPVFRDVAVFTPSSEITGAAEGVVGGFPCQAVGISFSTALRGNIKSRGRSRHGGQQDQFG